ncbi:MAG: DNA polymerase III subunit delta [Rhodospirillales bacterium 20-64-7]|nr:MAG: DNA polymerase III subunit delta [Rhodospirillales bacterium 20-64-7]
MKLDAGRIDAFLKNPTAPVVLIYGPDAGLVAERGLALLRAVPGAAADPFRFAELHNPDPASLLSEATAASLTGGRRVVRVRDAHDTLAKPVETLLQAPPDALVILEAGELTAKSKLRGLAEKSAQAAAIACYAIDAARLPGIVTSRLRAAGITIDADAAAWVANNIAGEEGPLRQAVELLTLYAGTETRLTLADVSAALADGGDTSMQDAVDAVLAGDPPAVDRAVTLAYEEGTAPVGILRVLLGELMRLRAAAGAVAAGASASEAMAAMRPPVFFKRQNLVSRALQLWTVGSLTEAIRVALAAESACKQTLTPDEAFCRQTLLGLASRARSAARAR